MASDSPNAARTADPRDGGERILVVRLSALGDVVHALPLLDALRRARPDAHIGWLVEEGAATLLEGHPQIDRLWVFRRRALQAGLSAGRIGALAGAARFVRELRAARYDTTLDAQCNLRSATLARLSGARRRIGFAPPFTKEQAHRLSTERVVVPQRKLLKVERNFELLRPLGIDATGARAVVPIPEEARAAARRFVEGLGGRPVVALHPGVSGFGVFKQWDPERFSAAARRLRDERGARCMVTWGPGERSLAERVAADSEGAAVVAPDTSSILELAALCEASDVVVGGDTGPIHLAAAIGTPVVALFGPKDPEIYAPWDARTGRASTAIWKHVHCSPCGLRRCDNVICMPAIEVDDVTEGVRRALSEPAGSAPEGLRAQA